MESRKIQVTGKSTFVVSLPKKWVNRVGLKCGDSVVMDPRPDGTMLLKPTTENRDEHKAGAVIKMENDDMGIFTRKFIGAYLAGYNTIEIHSSEHMSAALRQNLKKLIHRTIGLEIIDEGPKFCVVKNLIDSSDFSMAKGLRRMHLITKEMHRNALCCSGDRCLEVQKLVMEREDDVDKIYWMIARQYNIVLGDVFFAEKLKVTPKDALGYLLVARSLERIADHAAKLARNNLKLGDGGPLMVKITASGTASMELLEMAMNSFHSANFDLANEAISKGAILESRIDGLSKDITSLKGEPEKVVAFAYIIDSLKRTLSYTMDIAEIAINHDYATKIEQR